MLTAYDKDGNKYVASKETERKDYKYICPVPTCKLYMFIEKSDINAPHFVHYTKVVHDEEPEHTEHYEMIMNMYEYFKISKQFDWIKNLELGKPIRTIDGSYLIPDIYIETDDDKKIAIECQYSVYPSERIKEKTQKYSNSGVYTLWIFHKELYLKRFFKNIYNFLSPYFDVDILTKSYELQKFYFYDKYKYTKKGDDYIKSEITDKLQYLTSFEILYNGYDKVMYFNKNIDFVSGCISQIFDDLKLIFDIHEPNINLMLYKLSKKEEKEEKKKEEMN